MSKTPAEQAAVALESQDAFCRLTSQARIYKFPGYWEGSAYRSHPCGVIEGFIKLTNYWHVDNSCSIQITDGNGWSRDFCRDSFANGNPHPQPIEGASFTVWDHGKWRDETAREALEPKVLDLLTRIADHVERAQDEQRAIADAQEAARHKAQRAGLNSAITKAAK